MKLPVLFAAIGCVSIGVSAHASDRTFPAQVSETKTHFETLTVVIRKGGETIWAGQLTIGPRYDGANFSQSKNEAALPCEGEAYDPEKRSNVSNSFNMSISRANWQQEPDQFNISFNRSSALRACEGQGNNSSGFNRVLKIDRGGSVTINGEGGYSVTVARP